MEKSKLKIFNNPPVGMHWKEAWEGEASIRFLETLQINFEKLGFEIHIQVIIVENNHEMTLSIERIFLYKIFLRKINERI
jgi:hypothetical protein